MNDRIVDYSDNSNRLAGVSRDSESYMVKLSASCNFCMIVSGRLFTVEILFFEILFPRYLLFNALN